MVKPDPEGLSIRPWVWPVGRRVYPRSAFLLRIYMGCRGSTVWVWSFSLRVTKATSAQKTFLMPPPAPPVCLSHRSLA